MSRKFLRKAWHQSFSTADKWLGETYLSTARRAQSPIQKNVNAKKTPGTAQELKENIIASMRGLQKQLN